MMKPNPGAQMGTSKIAPLLNLGCIIDINCTIADFVCNINCTTSRNPCDIYKTRQNLKEIM